MAYVELGICRVIFAFCATSMLQNAKIMQKITTSVYVKSSIFSSLPDNVIDVYQAHAGHLIIMSVKSDGLT